MSLPEQLKSGKDKVFRNLVRRLCRRFDGAGGGGGGGAAWSIHAYLDESGAFDYEQYRQAQVSANQRKIESVWAQEENIRFLADYLRRTIANPKFGICHGTRRGLEQRWFRQYLGCEVIGTEISETATEFPDTIQWDFHETKPEWLNSVDFIYSNSLDHSYDPERCLNAWVSCLRTSGLLIIEHSADDVEARESDPFGAQLAVMPYLVLQWAKGAFSTREIIQAPKSAVVGDKEHACYFLMIRRN